MFITLILLKVVLRHHLPQYRQAAQITVPLRDEVITCSTLLQPPGAPQVSYLSALHHTPANEKKRTRLDRPVHRQLQQDNSRGLCTVNQSISQQRQYNKPATHSNNPEHYYWPTEVQHCRTDLYHIILKLSIYIILNKSICELIASFSCRPCPQS